jgi:hypothetical protein
MDNEDLQRITKKSDELKLQIMKNVQKLYMLKYSIDLDSTWNSVEIWKVVDEIIAHHVNSRLK